MRIDSGSSVNEYRGVSYINTIWLHVYVEINKNGVARFFKNGQYFSTT
jgi:hypothetical protein